MLLRVDGYPRTTPPSLPGTRQEPDLRGPSTCVQPQHAACARGVFPCNALKQERITGLSEAGVLINGKGIVAVYPEGQFGPGKNGYSGVAGCTTTDNHLPDNLCLDSNRFYASGKSNGAASPTCSHARQPLRYLCACLTCTLRRCQPYQLRTISDRIIPFGGQDADKEGRKEYATPTITQFRKVWAAAKVGGIVKLPSAIKLKNLTTTTLDMYQRWFPETTSAREGEAYFSNGKRLNYCNIAEGLVGAW
ncbi:hypothetical protein C8F01DRAFT_1261527 [Mycena amicta]|nr:hypothetical protein C8F01DRAFT_1261527 [Mycena amicta]